MVKTSNDPLLVALLGPTASGKTALSLSLAEQFSGEIISCDSVAIYREMEIGTAKPSLEERARAPHHLIDVAAPNEPYTAGDYCREARAAAKDIVSRSKLPIVTGGTGLYLRSMIEGLFAGPQRNEALRERLRVSSEKHESGWLHKILSRMDAASAARIHANDIPKLIRAIEVCLSARTPLSEALQSGRDPLTGFRILRIGLNPDRQLLYDRINRRAARMFAAGLIEETAGLMARYGGDLKVFDSLGYRQARLFLDGSLNREDAIAAAQQGHRNYAKRQLTWFRREPDVHWIDHPGDFPETIDQVKALIAAAM